MDYSKLRKVMITINNVSGEHKKHDTALRHRIRNLRAKVRLLLPLDLCCKEQKRSKNLIKMGHNRQLQLHFQQHRWNHAKENISELFVPAQPVKMEKHLFEKLTPSQIEQIKEDKMYYVGQEFLTQFDQFLEMREKEKQRSALPAKLTHFCPKGMPELNHKSSLSFGEDVEFYEKPSPQQTRIKNQIRMQGIQAKRKLITEQDLTRRAYIKVKGKEKQQRHLANYQRSLAEKQQQIRERNRMNMMKTAQSLKRKPNLRQISEVNQMSQQLRTLCLLRQSKSSNLLTR